MKACTRVFADSASSDHNVDNMAAMDVHVGCDAMKIARLYKSFTVFS